MSYIYDHNYINYNHNFSLQDKLRSRWSFSIWHLSLKEQSIVKVDGIGCPQSGATTKVLRFNYKVKFNLIIHGLLINIWHIYVVALTRITGKWHLKKISCKFLLPFFLLHFSKRIWKKVLGLKNIHSPFGSENIAWKYCSL